MPSFAVQCAMSNIAGGRVALGAGKFYRLFALRCVEIAREMADSNNKATLLAMAQMWLGLAEQAEKNTHPQTIMFVAPQE